MQFGNLRKPDINRDTQLLHTQNFGHIVFLLPIEGGGGTE